jgi:DNA repair exonuclease SbcCD ATPase subunit
MMKRSLLWEMLCGLLIGLLIMPAQPAQAQWTVFDPSAYTQRIKSELKRALEWSEKIRQHQMLYTNAVQQLTTLGGILERVDEELAKNKDLARLTNDISDIIRDSVKLKNQIENQTRYQIAALQRIDNRVRNGIFDPEQDLQDFEDYLMHSMGRNSKQTIRLAVNTANADAILQVWMDQRRELSKKRAEAYKQLDQLIKKLDELEKRAKRDNKPLDPSSTQPLNEAVYQTQTLIGKLESDIAALEEKIQQRLNAHGLRLSDMENFAYQIESSKAAWLELQQTKQEINKAFDAAVVEMNNTP